MTLPVDGFCSFGATRWGAGDVDGWSVDLSSVCLMSCTFSSQSSLCILCFALTEETNGFKSWIKQCGQWQLSSLGCRVLSKGCRHVLSQLVCCHIGGIAQYFLSRMKQYCYEWNEHWPHDFLLLGHFHCCHLKWVDHCEASAVFFTVLRSGLTSVLSDARTSPTVCLSSYDCCSIKKMLF